MLEPDVTITDYVLAVQCLGFALLLARKSRPWFLLFASVSLGSFTGGTVHGFIPNEESPTYGALWRITLISIGITALAGWHVGASFLTDSRAVRLIRQVAVLQFCLFSVIILLYSQEFLFAALNYLPSALFLLVVFAKEYLATERAALLGGAIAIVLTFAGSFVQITGISLHPQYFNHNALYHAIQFGALCLLFAAAHWDSTGRKYAR